MLADNFGSEDYGVAVRKDDAELLTKLDQTLDAMVADGSAKTIYDKWFSEAKQ